MGCGDHREGSDIELPSLDVLVAFSTRMRRGAGQEPFGTLRDRPNRLRATVAFVAGTQTREEIEAVTHAWETALAAHDLDALLACYAPDAVLESPVAAYIQGSPGVCRGHEQLRPFLAEVVRRTPEVRQYHRAGFFTDGHRATWEYPRLTPTGEQMDFVEVMEIADGLIHAHRVYWGWKGVDVLANDEYHRDGPPDGEASVRAFRQVPASSDRADHDQRPGRAR